MATFRLKYKDNKEDMYILNEDRKKGKIIEGKTLDYLISIICNEEIINGKVVNNTLYLFYKNDALVIDDFDLFLLDDKYPELRNKYYNFRKKVQEENRLKGKEIVEQKTKKAIKKDASITGIVITTILGVSLMITSGSKIATYIKENSDIKEANVIFESVPNDYRNITLNFKPNINIVSKEMMSDYKALAEKYGNKYGIDPNIILAIIAQNGSEHATNLDENGRIGIMKVNATRANEGFNYYDFEENNYGFCSYSISDLSDLEVNIEAGCMALQEDLRLTNNNILAALEMYNSSKYKVSEVITEYTKEKYTSKKETDNDEISRFELPDDEEKFYYNIGIKDLEDFNWLAGLSNENGRIYSYDVLSYIPENTPLVIKVVSNASNNGAVLYNINNTYNKTITMN